MEQTLRISFEQFDKQMIARRQQLAWIKLNNLYLSIERGTTPADRQNLNACWALVREAYHPSDPMAAYWLKELEKLPNYFEYCG